MNTRLSDIRDSFEGVIPSVIATTGADGMPNISYLSHVHYIDERHVALSNQFFSKTAANVRDRGVATLMVVDGRTGRQHILDLRFLRSTTEGEFFEGAASHLAVMSLSQGMADVMKLRSLEIYEVHECRPVVPAAPLAPAAEPETRRDHLHAAARLCAAIAEQSDAEAMLDCALEGMEARFGFANAVVLVPDEEGGKLSTIASRGYPAFGIGSEIPLGMGTIGVVAALRRPLRICDMRRGERYALAVQAEAMRNGLEEIPLPSLPQARSQLAVPLSSRARLVGVLFVESERAFAFSHADEEALSLVASQLATNLLLTERDRPEGRASPSAAHRPAATTERRIAIRYFPFDGSIFVDGGYVIRGLPGRLLLHFLSCYLRTGRTDFTNREVRRDPSLRLPEFKDNLETRLILLRRRLEERGGPIRLSRPDRGQIRLECDGVPEIETATADHG
ncbi:GAF domain-containing protein [Sphingomonas sp. CBMAI 2297]|uniref:GAF domain-containing protein n=1 Tax=Sphingomonas sp. CBMAI 2297 TaxID=2991720 RepID=UPI002457EEF0|nr:GAF domain-containing protein [Sphingomonas sp. CBMAI 2297]MDH4746453.1 GAF domain-containing protein [Sphingomonas sp. CBMAI 2297]